MVPLAIKLVASIAHTMRLKHYATLLSSLDVNNDLPSLVYFSAMLIIIIKYCHDQAKTEKETLQPLSKHLESSARTFAGASETP